ncbi:hypothetical protein BD770DRAFT_402358 [Pilaira anomala]|nr:hypothetical protein BD770DRAFT_402358 [Pilaira anomala]
MQAPLSFSQLSLGLIKPTCCFDPTYRSTFSVCFYFQAIKEAIFCIITIGSGRTCKVFATCETTNLRCGRRGLKYC